VISVSSKISGLPTSEPLAPSKGSSTGSVAAADKAPTDAPAASPSAQTGDQVTFTTSARSLQKLSDAIAQTPVVDATKVASIKQALSGGTYAINASSIADKMLQAERGLK
jgi:negative regulator of flagellin synthesis FlgM